MKAKDTRRFLCLIFFSLIFASCSTKSSDKEIPELQFFKSKKFHFQKGESLNYEVDFGFISLGSVQVSVFDPKPDSINLNSVQINTKANGASGVSYYTKIEHDWNSWIDTISGYTIRNERKVRENKYFIHQKTRFLPDSQRIEEMAIHKPGSPVKIYSANQDRMFDLVNVIWQIRYADFAYVQPNDTLPFVCFFDGEWLVFKLLFRGEREIKMNKKKRKVYFLQPTGVETKFLQGEFPVDIFIERNLSRRPLLVSVNSYIGNLNFSIKD